MSDPIGVTFHSAAGLIRGAFTEGEAQRLPALPGVKEPKEGRIHTPRKGWKS